MHPLHDYVAKQLADKVKSRVIVVWYDEHKEFVDFIGVLSTGIAIEKSIHPIRVGDLDATLARLREVARSQPQPRLDEHGALLARPAVGGRKPRRLELLAETLSVVERSRCIVNQHRIC